METEHYEMLRTLNPSQVIAAEIIGRGGTIMSAAQAIEMHRATVSNWANNHPEFMAEVNRVRADARDETAQAFRELTLSAVNLITEQVVQGDVKCAILWLKMFPPKQLTEQFVGPRSAEDVIERTRNLLPGEFEIMNDRFNGVTTEDAEMHMWKRLMLEGP